MNETMIFALHSIHLKEILRITKEKRTGKQQLINSSEKNNINIKIIRKQMPHKCLS